MSIIPLTNRRKEVLRNLRDRHTVGVDGFGFDESPPAGVRAIGIDLGTTNTVVSWFEPGHDSPITLDFSGSFLIPSVLTAGKERVYVGHDALVHSDEQGVDLVRSTKRHIGKKKSANFGDEQSRFRSGDRDFTAVEAAIEILKHVANHPILLEEKERFGAIWVVITVPAHFDDAARRATVEAAHSAGMRVLRIINEPTAAALAYSFLDDMNRPRESLRNATEDLVVFDLGGGTFDVSVVHRDGLVFKVLASEGDIALGGDDLDEHLAQILISKISPEFLSRRIRKDSPHYAEVINYAREIKHSLCDQGEVVVEGTIGQGNLSARISRDDFEQMSAPLLQRTLHLTEQSIHMAGKRIESVARILLVGGSTRMPLIRKMLESYFTGVTVDNRLEPDQAVSWGASLQAAIILGIAPDIVLVDVCNHTLGIGVVDDAQMVNDHYRRVREKFEVPPDATEEQLQVVLGEKIDEFHRELQSMLRVAPIIKRNSPLPAKKSEFFSTLYENQPAVQVIVAQGEGESVGDNTFIGSFLFPLEQPCPKGSKCEIQLTYDVNGIVHVYAKQIGTENISEAQFESTKAGPDILGGSGDDAQVPPAVLHLKNIKMGPASTESDQHPQPPPALLNALLLRSRKVLRKIPKTTEEFAHLQSLIRDYESLLRQELEGSGDEDSLELIEEKIADVVSRWD